MNLESILCVPTQIWKGINNRNARNAYWRDYRYSIIVISSSLVALKLLLEYEKSVSGIFPNIVGLIALTIAIFSLESSTLKLKDIQTDYWNVRGLDQGKERKYHDAIQAYDKAIRLDPQSIKCRINKANDLCEKGKLLCGNDDEGPFMEAFDVINHAILLGPKYPAKLKIGTEDESKAIQEYANALKTECDIILALADHRKEHAGPRVDELRKCALNSAKKAIREYPENSPQLSGAYASKGNALSKLGNHKEAIEACVEAIGRDRNEALVWAIKANAIAAKGDYGTAIKDLNKAISLKPGTSRFWYNKGRYFEIQGAILKKNQASDKAIELFYIAVHAYDRAIEYNKFNSSAWNQRGNVFDELGKYYHSEAVKSLRSYAMDISIYSNEGLFWLNKSIDLFRQVNYCFREALKSYDMAIDINPNDGMFYSNKADILKIFGNISGANAAYNKARELGWRGTKG